MEGVFRKACAPLSPTAREHNPYSIQNRCLARIIWPNEDSGVAKVNVEVSDRPKVFDAKTGNAHSLIFCINSAQILGNRRPELTLIWLTVSQLSEIEIHRNLYQT